METHLAVEGIPLSDSFLVEAREVNAEDDGKWSLVPAYATDVVSVNLARNEFNKHSIAVAVFNIQPGKHFEVKVICMSSTIKSAKVRPVALGINTTLVGDTITFEIEKSLDVMVEINDDKYHSLNILVNETDPDAPNTDTDDFWYFGAGLNAGHTFSNAEDGNIFVPSNTTVYLALGAFVAAKFIFSNVTNARITGYGFVYKTSVIHKSTAYPRELNGCAVLIERSKNITVSGIISLGTNGFSLPVCQASEITISRYRSFSASGNGDGIDLFCSRDVLIESCFLRNSDDTIAIYGHRWGYYGDTENVQIRDCTLLPDVAHAFQMGVHGCSARPERFNNIVLRNIDILDHEEHQVCYQGCISINAGDENLIENVLVENIRVEKITRGRLFDIRVVDNPMYTTAPGRGIRNVTLRNVEFLHGKEAGVVNPSQVIGYDQSRRVENIWFDNLNVGGDVIHEGMQKPRWYLVADMVPMYVNEHTVDVKFTLEGGEGH